jgi:hypothetical protein
MLKVIEINHSGVTVLKPDSDEDLEKDLSLPRGAAEVLIDLKGVSLLGNGFIRLLKKIRMEDPSLQKKIRLLNPGPLAEKALRLAELDTVYEIQKIYPTAW